MNIFLALLFIGLGIGLCYLILNPKLKETKEKNIEIDNSNKHLQEEHFKLLTDNSEINKHLLELRELVAQEQQTKSGLEGEINALSGSLEKIKLQAEESAQAIYDKAMETMQNKLSDSAAREGLAYQALIDDYRKEYISIIEDCGKAMGDFLTQQKIDKEIAEAELADIQSKVKLAIAANIREEEKKQKLTFYTLGLSEIDIQEIQKIREVLPYLRNGRPIAKAIWECYYRNATTDLLGRVVGAGTQTGIYKITCLLDNKIYIGQARDLRDRLTTHIKCGLGIDTPNNKLYAAMLKLGVENFSFEIIEKCPAADLNKQEKYWIEFYQSNSYGYNMNAGGSRS